MTGLSFTAIGVGIMFGRFAPSFYKMLILRMGISFPDGNIICEQDYHLRAGLSFASRTIIYGQTKGNYLLRTLRARPS